MCPPHQNFFCVNVCSTLLRVLRFAQFDRGMLNIWAKKYVCTSSNFWVGMVGQLRGSPVRGWSRGSPSPLRSPMHSPKVYRASTRQGRDPWGLWWLGGAHLGTGDGAQVGSGGSMNASWEKIVRNCTKNTYLSATFWRHHFLNQIVYKLVYVKYVLP